MALERVKVEQISTEGGSPPHWSARRKHCMLIRDDGIWILGGYDGSVDKSRNDVWRYDIISNSWECMNASAEWSTRDGHGACDFNGNMFVIGGTNDPYSCKADVWKSEDGGARSMQMCSSAPWAERWQHTTVVHEDRIFVLGGWGGRYMNDVWSSSDGLHWIQESVSAQWKSRMFHCTVSLNGSMYVIGGSDGKTLLSDVWGSSDRGATWTLVCEAAPWGGRQGHSCVVVEGEVFLIGGLEAGGTRRNDVWKSSDCAVWAKVDCGPAVAWTARWQPASQRDCMFARSASY